MRNVIARDEQLTAHNEWADLKTRIQRHYDVATPLYVSLWGLHLHHGYWRDGSESIEAAQENLVAGLASAAKIRSGDHVLDVGCGVGASARYLAEHFQAQVTGINISESQLKLAQCLTAGCRPPPRFAVMDAEEVGLSGRFDAIWSIEAISHIPRKQDCFRQLVNLTAPRGRIAIVDWFKAQNVDEDSMRKYIVPITRGMLIPELNPMSDYVDILSRLGCRITEVRDISGQVAKTWDICLNLTRLPGVWHYAFSKGSDFVYFLRSFVVMKQALRAGAFRCGIIVAERTYD